MRALTCLAVATGLLAGATTAAFAQGSQKSACPSSASQASQQVWPEGSISRGQTMTATHPCGRQLSCSGGSSQQGNRRQCKWL